VSVCACVCVCVCVFVSNFVWSRNLTTSRPRPGLRFCATNKIKNKAFLFSLHDTRYHEAISLKQSQNLLPLIGILNIPSLNLGQKKRASRMMWLFTSVLPGKCRDSISLLFGQESSLSPVSNNYLITWRYIFWGTIS